ncbi:Na+/H+ antiporter [Arachnia propionica]|uniref:Na+/H+ antiporter n=1 Tax=Arachnia propionica TaxID=1750 RepID=UPI00398FB9A0
MEGLIIAVGVGIAVVAGNALAPKLRLPVPLTQVLLGFALAFVPGLESLHMPPEVVLLLFLPGLLFWESLTTSKNAIRRDLRGILITSTVFVVATAFAVAWIASSLGIPWEAALILGAAVAPPDATAAAALAKGLPRRQFMLLKAESLTNDGTALVVYTIAVGLALGGQYTPWDITRMAVVSFFGGILIGIAVAAVAYPAFRRLHEPITINMALLVTPYAAYLAAELVHASGVLAAVVAGLIISTLSNRVSTPESRTQAEHFWPLATSLLNGALFLLIGIETRLLVVNFRFSELLTLAGIAVGVAVTLVVSRFVFLQITVMIIRALDRRPEQRQRRLSYRARVVSAVSAFRGGVSLAIALSIPNESPFPYRDEVVLVAALAIVIGMAVQGPLLPKVIAWAAKGGHTGDDEEAELTEEQLTTEGRLAILEAVRPELPALAEQAGVSPRVAEAMEERLDDIAAHIGADDEEEDVAEIVALERLHGAVLRRKRELLGQFVRERRISDETARILRARMDLEEIHRNGYLPYE